MKPAAPKTNGRNLVTVMTQHPQVLGDEQAGQQEQRRAHEARES